MNIEAITENLPAILVIAGAAVALLKAIAIITPSTVDDKIATFLSNLLPGKRDE